MAKNKVITDYSRLPDDELSVFSQAVYDALNPNENFIWEEGMMAQFQTKITTYRDLQEDARNGSSSDVLKKNVAKTALTDQLRYMAVEVNQQAGNDLVKLKSSGFQLVKSPSVVGPMPKPTNFTVKTGRNSGQLSFNVDACPNCRMYFFYESSVPAPESIEDMHLIPSTTHRKNVNGFTPGTQYKCVCAYQGSDEELVYSDPVYIYAQ